MFHITKTQEKTIQITIKVKESIYQELVKYAARSGRPPAEIVRGFIDKRMNIEGYKEDIDFIRKNIREGEFKKEIRRILNVCRRNKCSCDIVLKDISTCCRRPENIFEWEKTVMGVVSNNT